MYLNFSDCILDCWSLTLFWFVLGDGEGVNGTEVNTCKYILHSNDNNNNLFYLFLLTKRIRKIAVSVDTIIMHLL